MDTNLKQYNIYVGFPNKDPEYVYTAMCIDDEDAQRIAYEESLLTYDTYEGSYNIRSYDDFVNLLLKENGLIDNGDVPKEILLDALSQYNSERNSTFTYYAKLTSIDTISQDNLILNYSFEDNNNISKISSQGD